LIYNDNIHEKGGEGGGGKKKKKKQRFPFRKALLVLFTQLGRYYRISDGEQGEKGALSAKPDPTSPGHALPKRKEKGEKEKEKERRKTAHPLAGKRLNALLTSNPAP